MSTRWLTVPLAVSTLLLASVAMAQTKGEGKKPDSKDAQADTPKDKGGSGIVRRDPNGITGVSPSMEAILKGNGSYAARDFPKAVEAYQEAVAKAPKEPLGYYMLGEGHLAAGKLEEADQAWQNGLKATKPNEVVRAKLMFVVADLRERQGRWDDAEAAWKEYQGFVEGQPKSNGYAATAAERLKMVATHKDLAVKYAKVKERIQQRLEETSKESKTEPKKPEPKKGK